MNRASLPLPSGFLKTHIIRDNFKRVKAAENEVTTMGLKYVARNTTLPTRVRVQAQLQLANMPNYARVNQVKNRCLLTGRGRGVFRAFRMCRYQFRENALAGELPGVKKASW
ncbi:mitochondrial 37S ribosomal protein uS14m [Dipodascopsis tothii]|uniref:mitochondrial 37S ribosomal protein uS14m n=1 Tax=Dipodascopsis tothii TaxID=44089 RepID=UPI0034CE0EA1